MHHTKITQKNIIDSTVGKKRQQEAIRNGWRADLINSHFDPDTEPCLVLICGAPGTGKTTLAKDFQKHFFWDYFEADQYFTDTQGNYSFSRDKLEAAHSQCRERCESCLEQGSSCVISNTSTRIQDVQEYAAIAEKHNAKFVVIVLHNQHPSTHPVPENVIQRHRRQMKDTCRVLRKGGVKINHLIEVDLS